MNNAPPQKTGKVIQVVAVYLTCPHCGSADVASPKTGAFTITIDDLEIGTAHCDACDRTIKIPTSIFRSR